MADHYRNDRWLSAATKVGDRALPGLRIPGKPKDVFDGVDALLQLGTNNERRLNSKDRIAL